MTKLVMEMSEKYASNLTRESERFTRSDVSFAFFSGYAAAQPKWISVKDRLPEDGQSCIYVIHIPKKNEWKLDYGEWQAEENVFYGEYIDYRDLNWTLTHWMPLPEAPKENE